MKKDVLRKLREQAATLPLVYEKASKAILGAEVLKHDPKAKNNDGKAIRAKNWYVTTIAKEVNHFNKLKSVYEKAPKGKQWEAVERYCQAAVELHEDQTRKANKKVEEVVKTV